MTLLSEVEQDPKYKKVLDQGFVGLVDYMGSDSSVVQAARTSYGSGTRSVREDRGLIRYLMKHKHTSPFEMIQVKLHIKAPIFVIRQLIRHRTSSLNEQSLRYSKMEDEFYVPDIAHIQPQSANNKQGRSGTLSAVDAVKARDVIVSQSRDAYDAYLSLLDEFNGPNTGFTDDYTGIARELARAVLPVSGYTELYWSQNLHNLFHLLKLRMDPHAQYEIRVLAEEIYNLIQPLFPICCEAFEDYVLKSKTLSSLDSALLSAIIKHSNEFNFGFEAALESLVQSFDNEDAFRDTFKLTKREFDEFKVTLGIK